MAIKSVLFVCMGNICRSPTGEGVLQSQINERSMADRIAVDSAGTIGYHSGNPADSRMQSAAKKRGYQLNSRARQVKHGDLDQFDLVVAMDRDNLRDLRALHSQPQATLKLLSDFLPEGSPADVPDPYYGGPDGFETVLDMIESAGPQIIEFLIRSDEGSD